MADAAAKKKRSAALGKFTRNLNTLSGMLDTETPEEIVKTQFEKLRICYNTLEDVHDAFLEVTEIEDIETDKDGIHYLDKHSETFNKTVNRYSEYLKSLTEINREELNRKETLDRETDNTLKLSQISSSTSIKKTSKCVKNCHF